MQKAPRMTDGLLSLAQIYEDGKNYKMALEVWQKYLEVMEED